MPQAVFYKERRTYSRRACQLCADLDDYENAYSANVLNIGLGGAFIEPIAEFKPQIGQEIIMTIPFKEKEDYLIITGKVVWQRPEGLGISFQNLNTVARQAALAGHA